MTAAKLASEGDQVELLVDKDAYGLKRGDRGKIIIAYDPYGPMEEGDFEVYFESIDTSLILTEAEFKVL